MIYDIAWKLVKIKLFLKLYGHHCSAKTLNDLRHGRLQEIFCNEERRNLLMK